ncbi:MAG: DUF1579 family protein, partial [Bdellovibrionota bacterium]
MGIIGYDNVEKKFETVWLDTMTTGMTAGSGEFDAKKKAIKETGDYSCPITEVQREYRSEFTLKDKNKMVYAMYGKGLDGSPEFKQMEMTYTRAK